MKTELTILAHEVAITPSIDALSDNARDDIIEEIVDRIIDEAGCIEHDGVMYDWEIVSPEGEDEHLREQLNEAIRRLNALLENDEVTICSGAGEEIEDIISLLEGAK